MPTILTPQELQNKYGVSFTKQTQPQQTRGQETMQDVGQAFSSIKSRFQTAGQEMRMAGEDLNQGIGSAFLQQFGAGAKAVSGSLGDLFTGAVKGVLSQEQEDALKLKIGEATTAIMSNPTVSSSVKSSIDAFNKLDPETQKNLQAVFNIGVLGADVVGAGAAGKVVTQAAKQGLKTGANLARGTANVVGKGTALTGAAIEKSGKKVIQTLFTPDEALARRIINYQANGTIWGRLKLAAKDLEKAPATLVDTIIRYNLSGVARGNIGARAKRVANDLFENQVKPVLSGIQEKASKTELFTAIRKDIEKVKDISARKGLLDAFDALADDYKHVSSWSYKTLDEIKSSMAKRLPSKVWKGQDIAGDMNNLRLLFSAHARQMVRGKLPKEILDIYDQYGNLKIIADRGAKALTKGFDAGILGITSEAIRVLATPVATIGGRAIKEVGTGIKKVGQFLQR